MPAPILPTNQIHLPEHEKYKNALTLAARPLGTDASTKPQSEKFEDICVEFDFPRPREQKPGEKVLDENLPNIFVYTIEEDYLALARSLAQTKKCNPILISSPAAYVISPVSGNFEITEGAVYKDDEIILSKFPKAIPCHYLLSSFVQDNRMGPIEKGATASNGIPSIRDMIQDKIVIKKILLNHNVQTPAYLDCNDFLKLSDEEIAQRVHAFCTFHNCKDFVVKPTNTDGGNGVCFFTIDKTLTAAHYIKGLLISGMQAIVEQRIFALPFEVNGVQQDWNVRVFVTRDADNHYIVGGMLVRSDSYGKPVNLSISAHVMLFEDVMRLAKVSDEEHEIINQKIDEVCVRATMHVISDLLEGHPAPVSQQQDWMGIDIMVAKEGSEYVPYIIELNNEDSGRHVGA